ncbi:MAG: SufD family Fe-S cluster assembly protein, partial [Myxococcota bacterium]
MTDATTTRNGSRNGWLQSRREQAMGNFRALGLPTTGEEAWRYTSLAGLAAAPEAPTAATSTDASDAAHLLAHPACALTTAHELVFVDGQPLAGTSQHAREAGWRLVSLAAAMHEMPALIEAHLGRVAEIDGDALAALNTASFTDVAVLHLPKGVTVAQPTRVVFLTSERAQTMALPRLLVVAEEQSAAQLVEVYAGLGGAYATNAVTEITLGVGARLEHVRVQDESHEAHHLGLTAVHVATQAHYSLHSLHRGAHLARHETRVLLDGEGAEATLNSLSVAADTQHTAQRTVIEHRRPGTKSEQLHKSIVDGRATSVFDGLVRVARDAQQTQARQTSRSLLLSKTATANAKPQLEIYADDVKCNHGA